MVERIGVLQTAFRLVRARLEAVVIFPDHLHCLWTLPPGDADFSTRWSLIKGHFSPAIEKGERVSQSRATRGERGLWQRRFWEHLIRDQGDFNRHVDYVHWNPVKHGWVRRVADWPIPVSMRSSGAGSIRRIGVRTFRVLWQGSNASDAVPFVHRILLYLTDGGESNCHELHHVCLEILEWGGVKGVSSQWLRESCANKSLRCKIYKAVDLLITGPTPQDWKYFDGQDLAMNSGITKIYAFGDPDHIPIYDGRVGAGLGLLVRKYLEQRNHTLNTVPPELCFPWGAGQGPSSRRNPSCKRYKFPPLRSRENPDGDHAKWCWRAGRILRDAVKVFNARQPPQPVALRELEDALRMIGYDVRSGVSLCSWCKSATLSGNGAAGNWQGRSIFRTNGALTMIAKYFNR